MITRPLLAIYVVTSEQNPFGILISQPNNNRKWVVEKFYGISPGLVCSTTGPDVCLPPFSSSGLGLREIKSRKV